MSNSSRPHENEPTASAAWLPLLHLVRWASRSLERFLQIEAASGVVLLATTAIALAWANSPWTQSYVDFWHTPLGLRVGPLRFERTLEWIVNDGLMVVFFFVVGLEIRREVDHGELSEWRRAALPAAAAVGGMIAPATLYLIVAPTAATRAGWGVPMATDIAFAVGILSLLGKRVPAALRVLLLALAVIDDLGAIAVIAAFYSSGIALSGLLIASLGFGSIVLMQRVGIRRKLAYVPPAIVAWAGIYSAGVHPTIAGVIVGLMTPVRAGLDPDGFVVGVTEELKRLSLVPPEARGSREFSQALRRVEDTRHKALSPAEDLIASLHPWVAFAIMPIFALANAGVVVTGEGLDGARKTVFLGILLGLVVGKPLGVLLTSWLALRLRLGSLPRGLDLRHLVVLGCVAGVGFTMALFIAQLAFGDAHLLASAKLGILVASIIAAVLGLFVGLVLLPRKRPAGSAETVEEAEGSTEM